MAHRNLRATRFLSIVTAVLAVIGMSIGMSAGGVHAAPAVQGTTLELDPQNGTIVGAATLDVDVRVESVTDLYGFDVRLAFDPSIVQVVDFVPGPGIQMEGGSFMSLDLVLSNTANNALGTLQFVATQLTPTLPVSGSGVLFTIRFEGVTNGVSDLEFTASPGGTRLSDPNGDPIAETAIDGTVTVTGLLAAEVEGFSGRRLAEGARLDWRTLSESGNVGFHLIRQEGDGPLVAVTPTLIPSRAIGGELGGADYTFVDRQAPIGALRYWLEDVDVKGLRTRHGPVDVSPAYLWVLPETPPRLPGAELPILPSISPR